MDGTRDGKGAAVTAPFYLPQGDEVAVFEAAAAHDLPVLLKGPTGVGKTRFVAHMAARLGRRLYTVACHDDLSAADLVGRYLLKGGETIWVDGPLTRAVREGAICYLDEVVEARKDVAVVLHPLTDDRRILPIDRTGEELAAAPGFMLVASYNPGYQNILKTLKPSTRQRFLALDFDFPALDHEVAVVVRESGLEEGRVRPLVRLAGKLRNLDLVLRRAGTAGQKGRRKQAASQHRRAQGRANRLQIHCFLPARSSRMGQSGRSSPWQADTSSLKLARSERNSSILVSISSMRCCAMARTSALARLVSS